MPSTAKDPVLPGDLSQQSFQFYRRSLHLLEDAGVPVLVGGAYALACYTGIVRHTKDFDLFLRRDDVESAVQAFRRNGFHADIVFSHWLAKAWQGDDFIDLIYGSGNALCPVDEDWFRHATEGNVLGVPARLVPVEEMIWQKMFIMERERFDGADVNHLLLACGAQIDWARLLARTGPHWRVLLAHLILFEFAYPDARGSIPPEVRNDLMALAASIHNGTLPHTPERCQGTYLSRLQYAIDVETRGYQDSRILPLGRMTPEQANCWTDAGR